MPAASYWLFSFSNRSNYQAPKLSSLMRSLFSFFSTVQLMNGTVFLAKDEDLKHISHFVHYKKSLAFFFKISLGFHVKN